MFTAGALVAGTSLFAKILGLPDGAAPGLNPFQISAGRFVFGLATLLLFVGAVPKARPGFGGAKWQWHLMRVICGWLGVTAMFAAVSRMPIAEATAVSFISPLVTMTLAIPMLGERIGPRKVIAAALAVAGAVLVLRPGSDAFQLAGLLALAAAGFMGLEAIFIKRLADTEPALRILIINNTIGACISLSVASFVWTWPSGFQWVFLVAIGSIMVSAQAFFMQALRRGDASFVMPAFYSVLIFAAAYDFAVFAVLPGWVTVAGSALIVSGALVLVVRSGGSARRGF